MNRKVVEKLSQVNNHSMKKEECDSLVLKFSRCLSICQKSVHQKLDVPESIHENLFSKYLVQYLGQSAAAEHSPESQRQRQTGKAEKNPSREMQGQGQR